MHRSLFPVLALLVLLLASPARATSVVELDLATHIAESTAVIEATVGPARVTVDEETGRPMTHTALTVVAVLAGDAPPQLEVSQHKGRVGDRELLFPGDGTLEPGTVVVVFVTHAEGRWWLTALSQSVYTVDGLGDDAVVTRQMDGLVFFQRDPVKGNVVPAHRAAPTRSTLGALRRSIAAAKGN